MNAYSTFSIHEQLLAIINTLSHKQEFKTIVAAIQSNTLPLLIVLKILRNLAEGNHLASNARKSTIYE